MGRLEVLEMIMKDMKDDKGYYDGLPFTGNIVAEYLGKHSAAIMTLALIVKSLIKEKKDVSNS